MSKTVLREFAKEMENGNRSNCSNFSPPEYTQYAYDTCNVFYLLLKFGPISAQQILLSNTQLFYFLFADFVVVVLREEHSLSPQGGREQARRR